MTVACHRQNDRQLLSGLHSCVDAGRSGEFVELCLALFFRSVHSRSCDDMIFGKRQAGLACNRSCGLWIVTGDHHHVETRVAAGADRIGDFGPQRVVHSSEAKKDEIDQMPMAVTAVGISVDLTFGEGQNT